jgi:hypothetical protein
MEHSHRRNCYSFEASGHEFEPLDGIGGIVLRLYCSNCGRVIPANFAWNNEMWANVPLPAEVAKEMSSEGDPVH